MQVAGFILAINLCVAGFFAAAFLFIAAQNHANLPARWFAAAFLLGMLNVGAEWSIPLFANPRLTVFAAFSAFLAALVALGAGLAARYRRRMPWPLVGALFIGSLVVNLAIFDMPRQSVIRLTLYQAPYFIMQGIAAWLVLSARPRRPIDLVLGSLVAASAAHFLLKPAIALAVGGPGASPQAYIGTAYALYSQALGAILMVATGLMLLALLVRDMLSEITVRSETDELSALFNRRGFEERAAARIGAMGRAGIPLSLVICDLDHFKEINDRYGHATGDRVIAGFAGILREATAAHHVAGRIGGEEFAVILPGVNAASARLFAEGVRNAYSYVGVEGLPDRHRLTASFGVAEFTAGDLLDDLMKRADAALYEAKKGGRNCVRVAPLPPGRRAWRDAAGRNAETA